MGESSLGTVSLGRMSLNSVSFLLAQTTNQRPVYYGSDTLESFLSKVTFESNLRKKLSRIENVLIVKVSFERRKMVKVFMSHVQDVFRK